MRTDRQRPRRHVRRPRAGLRRAIRPDAQRIRRRIVHDHLVRRTWQPVRRVCAADLSDTVPPAITAFSLALGSAPSMLSATLRPRSRAACRALTAPPRSADPGAYVMAAQSSPVTIDSVREFALWFDPLVDAHWASPPHRAHPHAERVHDRRTQVRDRTHPTPKFTSRWLPDMQSSDMELHVKTVAPCQRSSQRSALADGSVRQRHAPRPVLRNARP